MSIVYGIFFGDHNYSTTVIVDGKIVFAVEDEKITRVKSTYALHEGGLASLEAAEKHTGIKLNDADLIAISDLSVIRDRGTRGKESEINVNKYLDILRKANKPIKIYSHHQCHAASTYYLSGFKDKTLIVTSDGGCFEEEHGTIWLAEDGKMVKFKGIDKISNASLANLFNNACPYFGFKGLKDEGKIMGMAPDGEYNDMIYNVFNTLSEYSGDFNFAIPENTTLMQYVYDQLYREGWFQDQAHKEVVAYNLQKAFTNNIVKYFKDIKKHFPDYNKVCVAGGVFANVKTNQHLNEECGFEEIFVAPPMGDEGCAFGAAILGALELGEWEHKPTHDVFFGPEYSEEECDIEAKNWEVEVVKDFIDYNFLSDLIIDKKVIAIHHGKLEFGPRALGNRSVVMETTDENNHSYLNKRFGRSETMPFAPIVLKNQAKEIFDIKNSEFAAEFMTVCYNTKEEWINKIPAVIQKSDKTARPQLVVEHKHTIFYNILKEYYNKTPIPVLLNTSFNGHGEPIVNTPAEAFAHLEKGSIDYLLIGNKIYKKK